MVGERPRGHADPAQGRVPSLGQGRRRVRWPVHVREQRVRRPEAGVRREPRDPAGVFDYRGLNKALVEIATRRYAGKQRKTDTYQIILQADGSIPYSTIVSAMSAMRCVLPEFAKEVAGCALPTDDENLKKAKEPISPDGKLYDTARASYDPKKMALFHEIAFSSGLNELYAARGAQRYPQGRRAGPRGRRDPSPQHHADDGHDDDPPGRLHLSGRNERDRDDRGNRRAAARAVG